MINIISNKKAYDLIFESWKNYRNNSVVNNCIVDFEKMIKSNSKILDIGCGTGFPIDKYLLDCGHSVIGIDISIKMIEEAKKNKFKNAEFINVDFLEYCTNEKYDAIVAFDSLFHIDKKKQIDIYYKLSSLLSYNGYLLFTHGKTNSEITGEMFNKTFYYSSLDCNEVMKLLRQNGFEIIKFDIDYEEKTTGKRDLLVIAKKIKI